MKSVAVIGSGMVGENLANGFIKHGYSPVIWASRDPSKLADWVASSGGQAATLAEAASKCDVIVLCVPGMAAKAALEQCGMENLKGKTVVNANI